MPEGMLAKFCFTAPPATAIKHFSENMEGGTVNRGS